MSRELFEDLKAGLEEALAYARGEATGVKVHRVRLKDINVKRVRKKLGLSQQRFANLFGISRRTLENWEQGHRAPEGPARVLLQIIERKPTAVLEALGQLRKRA